ncbi:MAG: FISUMP domain-containing protein [Bacteroidales bacterium]|jgi:uncharacterized protein (TIGR02145 family)
MKILRVLLVIALTVIVSCKKDIPPTVETLAPTLRGATQVILNGNVLNEGSSEVSSSGFCWSLRPNPTVADSIIESSSGPGEFIEVINILPDSVYYSRAYATNLAGTAYGNEVTFTTQGLFTGSFTDARDGKSYRWVLIGDQIWMAENLAYLPSVNPPAEGGYQEPFYYVQGYDGRSVQAAAATVNYQLYGVLYNWKAMQTACPAGWHLPGDAEWVHLEENLGMARAELEETGYRNSGKIGRQVKSTSGWYQEGNGKNSSGLNVLPGGSCNGQGKFGGIGRYATFRTSSAGGSTFNFSRTLSYDSDGIDRGTAAHYVGVSARCIKN